MTFWVKMTQRRNVGDQRFSAILNYSPTLQLMTARDPDPGGQLDIHFN
jgi:hypothetical protein